MRIVLLALSTLALAQLLSGCEGGCSCSTPDGPPSAVLPLLVRTPDARIEEPGRLAVDPELGWGPYGLAGWDRAVGTDGARVFATTNQPRALLDLPATDARDRELKVRVRCSRPGEPGQLRLLLNDVSLCDPIAVGAGPSELVLPAPAPLWKTGQNVLALESTRGANGAWDTFHVSLVEYGTPRLVVDQDGGKRLSAGTGLVYRAESPGAFALRVEGTAEEAGELELRPGAMDTATGRTDFERFTPRRIAVPAGPFEHRIPLEPLGDGVLHVELVWRPTREGTVLLRRLDLEEAEERARPPILFVSIDTLAARHMSLYGYDRETTPELSRFAEDAVVFDHCVANAPWTLPSYLSVLSGLYPGSHTVELSDQDGLQLSDHDYWQLAENRWTLAEALRGRGYETAGIVDSHWLSPEFRLSQGFDVYEMGPAFVPFDEPVRGMAMILDELRGWLDRRVDTRPFFVFAHALDCHGPYWPEEPWRGSFPPPDQRTPVPARGAYRTNRSIPVWMAMTVVDSLGAKADVPDTVALEPLVARYDETILEMDAQLGRLFEILRERGLYDEALIVVSADHGESFEHDHYDHGDLWEDVLHVPLLVKLPGGALGGTRVEDSVQLVDLYPTVLDVLGLEPDRPGLHGRSLLPLARGETVAPRVTFSTGGFVRQTMVTFEGWKLIERAPGLESGDGALLTHPYVPDDWLRQHFPELLEAALTDELLAELQRRVDYAARIAELRRMLRGPYLELYDLANDPDERQDVSDRHPERVAELRALLERERERQDEARDAAEAAPFRTPLSAEQRAALDALGYGGKKDG